MFMAIKKISDSVKLESLTGNDTLLVNHDGTIAQVASDSVGGGKPIMFKPSAAAGGLLLGDRPATLKEVLDAFFDGTAYLEAGDSAGDPTFSGNNPGCWGGKIIGFWVSGSDTAPVDAIASDHYAQTTRIVGSTVKEFVDAYNAYFA